MQPLPQGGLSRLSPLCTLLSPFPLQPALTGLYLNQLLRVQIAGQGHIVVFFMIRDINVIVPRSYLQEGICRCHVPPGHLVQQLQRE